jgi:predicted GNAT superfamily acetyltransferase
MITYRVVTEQKDFIQVAYLEQFIWNMEALDVVSPHFLKVIAHTGGCVVGAFDGDTMVGCAFALAMRGEPRLWSHIAAVHPDYQRQGIGYKLKQEQRLWALAHGYKFMSWTFDPMMAANAHFNFHMLGVSSRTYHPNFYGDMQDALNIGLPSDRFEVLWDLQAPEAISHNTPESAPFLLRMIDDQPVSESPLSADWHYVEIPAYFPLFRETNKPLALAWKLALRDTVCAAFEQRYEVVDFVRQDNRNWYVLRRKS